MKKILPKSDFSKNVLTLMTGTTIAQAIPIAISPILTRIYTPEDFGVLALFIAITSIIASVVNGRYELAIMLPEHDEDAINIFALAVIINIFLSLLFLVAILLFHDFIVGLLESQEISLWLYITPLVVFFIGLYNALTYFNNRKEHYKDLRNATILKSIALAVAQVSIGLIKEGATGLVLGQVVSQLIANLKLLKNIVTNKTLLMSITIKRAFSLGLKNIDFVKFNVPSTLANNIVLQLPALMLPKLYGLEISGYFSLSQKLIALPCSLLSNSISQVFFQKMTENKNNKEKNMIFLINTMKKLVLLSFPISVLIFLFSSELFSIVFGESWRLSGEIAKYLAIVFFIDFIVSSLNVTLIVYERLMLLASWQFLYLFSALLLCFACFYWSVTFDNFLLLYIMQEILLRGLYLYFIILVVKEADYELNKVKFKSGNF